MWWEKELVILKQLVLSQKDIWEILDPMDTGNTTLSNILSLSGDAHFTVVCRTVRLAVIDLSHCSYPFIFYVVRVKMVENKREDLSSEGKKTPFMCLCKRRRSMGQTWMRYGWGYRKKRCEVAVGSAITTLPALQSCLGPLHTLCPRILLSHLHVDSSRA